MVINTISKTLGILYRIKDIFPENILLTISNTFSTSNGVKQGGVLSPILFNVYLDELFEMLSEQGLGCHLHGQFVGAFIYADDVTLLAQQALH